MPPKHPKHRVNPADRLALAIIGLKTGKYATSSEAAARNGVSETTLRARVNSIPTCVFLRVKKSTNKRPKTLRLTRTEENTLYNWIIQVHDGGHDMNPSSIMDMANDLLSKRGGTHGYRVSKDWVSGYLQFHPDVAEIIEQQRQRFAELDIRQVAFSTRKPDLKMVMETCMGVLHNMRRLAEWQNEKEANLLEICEKSLLVDPQLVREELVGARGWRDRMDETVKVATDVCMGTVDCLRNYGWDSERFSRALEEIEAVKDDTMELKGEIQRKFGGLLEEGGEEKDDEEEEI